MANILIVATTHEQARYYMAQMGVTAQNAKVIREPEDIQGYQDMRIAYVGEYWRIPGIAYIEEYASTHGMKEIEV